MEANTTKNYLYSLCDCVMMYINTVYNCVYTVLMYIYTVCNCEWSVMIACGSINSTKFISKAVSPLGWACITEYSYVCGYQKG